MVSESADVDMDGTYYYNIARAKSADSNYLPRLKHSYVKLTYWAANRIGSEEDETEQKIINEGI